MNNLQQLINKLAEAEKNATSGEWKTIVPDPDSNQFKDRVARFPYDRHQEEGFKVLVQSDRCDKHCVADCSTNHTCVELMEQEDNATLICLLRNELPTILEYLRKTEGLVEALERWKTECELTQKQSSIPFKVEMYEMTKQALDNFHSDQ